MITVKIPIDVEFEYEKCRSMYRKYQRLVGDDQTFKAVIKNTFFYSFYIDGELKGCIYCFNRDDKLFINGFSTRFHHLENIEAIKMVISWFNCDIYAESNKKTAIFCLLRAGFKKYKRNIYVYRR